MAAPGHVDRSTVLQAITGLRVLAEGQCSKTAIQKRSATGGTCQVHVDGGTVGIEHTADGVGGATTGAERVGGPRCANGVSTEIHGAPTQATCEIECRAVPTSIGSRAEGKCRSVDDVHAGWVELGISAAGCKRQAAGIHRVGVGHVGGHRWGGNPRIQRERTRARFGEVGGIDRA